MPGSIDDYRRKRDFAQTPEPAPEGGPREGPPVFVIHRHDASRLHYDLRLEMEGVLKSWAVPKGFSYDPDDKHLAVRTEDHPLEYEHFHGVIPSGQYGAGTMTIWDRGTYEIVKASDGSQAIRDGEVKVILRGRKLRGEWHLVKTRQAENTWLLFKSRDRYAGTPRDSVVGVDLGAAPESAFLEDLQPMEVGGTAEPFSRPDSVFEMAFTGRRVFAEKRGDEVAVRGLGTRLEPIERDLRALRAENALVDGMLVAPDSGGRPSKTLLAARLAGEDDGPIQLYVFDLLYFEDYDLRPLPLLDRKAALRALLPPLESVLYVDHVPGQGEELVAAVEAAGLRGVVAKRADAPYVAGPSDAWQAIAARAPAGGEVSVASALKGARAQGTSARVKYTNVGKVYWPAEGFTKGDLIAFYEQVADVLLPHLRDRPLHLHRYPDGIDGKSFYQKNVEGLIPDWIETTPVVSSSGDVKSEYIVCNDRDTLLFLANLGSIDLHPWMSRVGSLLEPDYTVIDLDPKEAPFAHVVEIARLVGEILHEIGLRPLLKTSGSTGLHIHVPLLRGYTYDHSRMFAEAVARVVARELPDIATVERVMGKREGRVYVDFGQNRREQTIVPPYVPRPVRGATVSTPLYWEELEDDLHLQHFTIQTVPGRIERVGDLYAPLLDDPQDLIPAIEALQERLAR